MDSKPEIKQNGSCNQAIALLYVGPWEICLCHANTVLRVFSAQGRHVHLARAPKRAHFSMQLRFMAESDQAAENKINVVEVHTV